VPALLEVRDLTVHYATGNEPAVVVNNLSLDVEEGEVVGLLGESGCGKTTLLLAILGLLPSSARVVGTWTRANSLLTGLRSCNSNTAL
jgi:ABC-type glutathione transport system ATPase component